jgi:hypothetical protein
MHSHYAFIEFAACYRRQQLLEEAAANRLARLAAGTDLGQTNRGWLPLVLAATWVATMMGACIAAAPQVTPAP